MLHQIEQCIVLETTYISTFSIIALLIITLSAAIMAV